jgi:type I restriction enzyme, S subunit
MEVKAGYKQTEVGIIPEEWKVQKLSNVAELTSSKRIFESDYVASGIPFYRGKEISLLINNASIEDEYFILDDKYNDIKRQFGAPQKGDILITAVGTLGNVYLVPNDNPFYFKDGNLIWLRKIKNVFPSYLAIQLRNRKTDIINNAIGSTQKALTIIVLNETLIPLPPTLSEQAAIAEALSDADALIEALAQLLAKKRQLKQGAMHELLTGKRRLPGFSGEWEVKQFGSVLKFQVGFPFSSLFFNEEENGVRLVKNRDLKNDDQVFYYSGNYDPAFLVQDGDVLVGMDGDFIPCLWTKGLALLNQRVGRIIPLAGLDRVFASYYLIEPLKLIENSTSSTTVKHLSHGNIVSIEMPLPNIEEQTAIAEILRDMDAEIAALEGKLSKARQVKHGMMSMLLMGRVRLVTE